MIRQTEGNSEQEQTASQERNKKLQREERYCKGDNSKIVVVLVHLLESAPLRKQSIENSLCSSFVIEVKQLRHEICEKKKKDAKI